MAKQIRECIISVRVNHDNTCEYCKKHLPAGSNIRVSIDSDKWLIKKSQEQLKRDANGVYCSSKCYRQED